MEITVKRGKRQYMRLSMIAEHHGIEGHECFRCKSPCRPDRAHIIDRQFDGLDGPQNLIPLCWRCHREQPLFGNGDERRAWLWLMFPNLNDFLDAVVAVVMDENRELLWPLERDDVKATDPAFMEAFMEAGRRSGLMPTTHAVGLIASSAYDATN